MSLPRIVIVGASGHGRVALDAARCQGRYEVVGWADTFVAVGTELAGLQVLGKTAELDRLAAEHRLDGYFLAVSNNPTRAQVHESLRQLCPRLELVSLIHPSAVVAGDVSVGPGSLILAGAVVNTGSRLGTASIVNTRASLDHDGELQDCACLLPGVVTGGNVTIGTCACVCLGAHLSHKVRIGEHTVVGAGSVVLADLPAYSLAYGVPARVIRRREAHERHF